MSSLKPNQTRSALFSSTPIAQSRTTLRGGKDASILFGSPQGASQDQIRVNFPSREQSEKSERVDTLLGSLQESISADSPAETSNGNDDNAIQRFQKRYAKGLGQIVSGAVGLGSEVTGSARDAALKAPGALLRAGGDALEWADFPQTAEAAKRLGNDADETLAPVNETLNRFQRNSVRGFRSGIESNFEAVGELAAHPRRTVQGVAEAVSNPVQTVRSAAAGSLKEAERQYDEGGTAQVVGWTAAQLAPGLKGARKLPSGRSRPKPEVGTSEIPSATHPSLSQTQTASLLRQTSEQARRQAVVVGGGPGGLRAGLELASRNIDVTILESRAAQGADVPAHLRPHQISLRPEALVGLEEVGAPVKTSPLKAEVSTRKQGLLGRTTVEHRPDLGSPTRPLDDPNLLRGDSVAQARISDVERSLLERARAQGIKIHSGYNGVLERDGDSYAVRARGQKGRSDIDLGVPDLVVVADGANSSTRASLGIPLLEQSAPQYNVGIAVNRGIGPENRKLREGPRGNPRYIMATGHSEHDATWVSSRLSPAEYRRGQKDPDAFTRAALAHARRATGEPTLNEGNVTWGAREVTVIQNRRAQQMTAGNNVVLYGDATGTGSPLAGGGLNLALTTHAAAPGRVADQLQGTPDGPRSVVFRDYSDRINSGLDVWHELGQAYDQ